MYRLCNHCKTKQVQYYDLYGKNNGEVKIDGLLVHIHSYKRPEPYTDKRVVVIGVGTVIVRKTESVAKLPTSIAQNGPQIGSAIGERQHREIDGKKQNNTYRCRPRSPLPAYQCTVRAFYMSGCALTAHYLYHFTDNVVVRYKTQMCCCGKSRAHKRGGGGHGKHGKAKKKRKVLHKCKDCGHRYATKDRLRKHREKKHHGHRRRDNDDDNNDDEIVDQQPISIIADVFMVDPNQQTGQYSVDGTGSAYEMTVGTTGDIFTSNIGGQPMAQLGLNSTPQDGTDEGCNCCGGGCDGDESCCETLCGGCCDSGCDCNCSGGGSGCDCECSD
ncbi:unnamed protein product [Medioppia subpectinata]|uniref:C2H2-type domain-containing protein n=1 Tax=Medioppia subpectinata TaxID=1979941 RepID=A0A7R9KJY1_9ACAR|nr:unnamed protein product [Medioppia subpectinata]CAG2103702.1 unnamed protein product [Medioppia subpectinata]